MAHTTIELEHRGCTFEVDVEGQVLRGGSNRHGSDEPPWIDVEGVGYTHPRTGRALSRRLSNWIDSNHGDYVAECLMDADE